MYLLKRTIENDLQDKNVAATIDTLIKSFGLFSINDKYNSETKEHIQNLRKDLYADSMMVYHDHGPISFDNLKVRDFDKYESLINGITESVLDYSAEY
jgi:hypothetical protein